jgi:hypothetical protein
MKKFMIRFGLGIGFFFVLRLLATAAHVDESVANDICGILTAVLIIAVFYFQKRQTAAHKPLANSTKTPPPLPASGGEPKGTDSENWKDWLRRFRNGYKFSNLGFKRLFIVGLVGIPLFTGIATSLAGRGNYEPEFTFEEFLGVMSASALAYLLVVPFARWAYGGFSITWVKRLFLVGLAGVPLFTAIIYSVNDYEGYFSRRYIKDFLPALFLTLLGYLAVVRAARWVCDGFAPAHRAQKVACSEAACTQQTPISPPEET